MKLIISGGGTGGHIYPAIAIAHEFRNRFSECEILFVGAKGKMEMEKVPAAGYPIEGLPISGLARKLSFQNLLFPYKVVRSLVMAHRIVKRFKPDLAIGVGGYASGPLLWSATRLGIPSLIQEQNSYAGLTNKWLAARVQKACVAYPNMDRFFPKDKIILTGNPVRKDILEVNSKRKEAFNFFDLDPNKKTILAFGGSLGARSINESMSRGLAEFLNRDIQLIWQTGKNSFEENPENSALVQHKNIYRSEFIYKMDLAYAAADIVISRAGAIAVSELCIVGRPTIFVPFPFAAEDHQTKNAEALSRQAAALVIKDAEARENLVGEAIRLLENEAQAISLEQNIKSFAQPEASKKIVDAALDLIASV